MTLDRISPRSLTWAEVDPARHPFDPAAVPDVVRSVAPPVPNPPRWVGNKLVGRDRAARWRNEVSNALVERYGRWACGWCWGLGEGDHDGGPVGGWCCVAHSFGTAEETLSLVADSLVEWRDWLEDMADRFDRVLPTLDPRQPADDLTVAWEIAVAQLVVTVADRTRGESAWYGHCRQVLGWLLTAAGIAETDHPSLIADATRGRFHSWSQPGAGVVGEIAERVAAGVTGTPLPPPPPERPTDDLSAWLDVRAGIDWHTAAGHVSGPVRHKRDAIAEHADERDFELPAALDEVRRAAAGGGPLTFALLAQWQRIVLEVDEAGFRTGPAFAKLGRERYGWWPELPALFDRCLAEATDDEVPLPSRAARVYLDVAFVHPFTDGNARSAMLALYYVLAREGVVLDHAAPVLRLPRVAHDAIGARELAGLIEVLVSSMHRRTRLPRS